MPTIKPKECRNCGKEFTPRRLSTEVVCSYGCAIAYAKAQREEKEKKEEEQGLRINMEGKPKNKRVAFPEVYKKENKADLQREINKLAKMIDLRFYSRCIDCGERFGTQIDGSHFHNVSGNENIRFNLHNIHAAKQRCNQFYGGRKKEYSSGLVERYGAEYEQFVDVDLPKKYTYVGLTGIEIVEKLAIVRKLIRDFDSFKFDNAIEARNQLNKIIGIYE